MILLDRFLSGSVAFPVDCGFIPGRLDHAGEDPLDVLIAVSGPTFSACGIVAKPVAVPWLDDQGEREPKVLCVPCEDPNWQEVTDLGDLSEQLRDEITGAANAIRQKVNVWLVAPGAEVTRESPSANHEC